MFYLLNYTQIPDVFNEVKPTGSFAIPITTPPSPPKPPNFSSSPMTSVKCNRLDREQPVRQTHQWPQADPHASVRTLEDTNNKMVCDGQTAENYVSDSLWKTALFLLAIYCSFLTPHSPLYSSVFHLWPLTLPFFLSPLVCVAQCFIISLCSCLVSPEIVYRDSWAAYKDCERKRKDTKRH